MATNSDDIAELSVHLGQTFAQTPNQRIDGLFADALAAGFRPDSVDDLVACHDAAARIPKRFQQPVLMQAQRRIQNHPVDPDLASFRLKAQALVGAVEGQRCSGTGVDKGQLEAKRNLQFIAVCQTGRLSSLPAR